jgi:hypothetical protein
VTILSGGISVFKGVVNDHVPLGKKVSNNKFTFLTELQIAKLIQNMHMKRNIC